LIFKIERKQEIFQENPRNNKRYLMKVIGYDASEKKVGADRSDAPFTISVVTVMRPNGGEPLTRQYLSDRMGNVWNEETGGEGEVALHQKRRENLE